LISHSRSGNTSAFSPHFPPEPDPFNELLSPIENPWRPRVALATGFLSFRDSNSTFDCWMLRACQTRPCLRRGLRHLGCQWLQHAPEADQDHCDPVCTHFTRPSASSPSSGTPPTATMLTLRDGLRPRRVDPQNTFQVPGTDTVHRSSRSDSRGSDPCRRSSRYVHSDAESNTRFAYLSHTFSDHTQHLVNRVTFPLTVFLSHEFATWVCSSLPFNALPHGPIPTRQVWVACLGIVTAPPC